MDIDLEESLRMFGWGGMSSEALGGLSMGEVKKVVTEVACMERGKGCMEAQRHRGNLVSYRTLSAGRHFIHRLPGSGKDGTLNRCKVLA